MRARVHHYAEGVPAPRIRRPAISSWMPAHESRSWPAWPPRRTGRGRYPAAARYYEELLAHHRAPIVLYNMAVSYEQAGKLTGARCTYFELLEAPTTPRMCQRIVNRLERLVELDPRPGAGCQEYGAPRRPDHRVSLVEISPGLCHHSVTYLEQLVEADPRPQARCSEVLSTSS